MYYNIFMLVTIRLSSLNSINMRKITDSSMPWNRCRYFFENSRVPPTQACNDILIILRQLAIS